MFRIITGLVCLIAANVASASTIQFIGAATTINDGSYYVLPYQVTINGANQLVTCFDMLDDVNNGDIWQAGILTMPEAAATGFFAGTNVFAGYERVAWLSAQTYSTTSQQIGLQHAIWNVFGAVSRTPDTVSYEASADAAAASNYAGFDFSSFRFIQQIGATAGAPGAEQAFVYSAITASEAASTVPEPGTVSMILIGLLSVGIASLRRTRHS